MPTGEPAGSIPNVGLFGEAIKGKLVQRPVIAGRATQSRNNCLFFEELVGSAAVAGSVN